MTSELKGVFKRAILNYIFIHYTDFEIRAYFSLFQIFCADITVNIVVEDTQQKEA